MSNIITLNGKAISLMSVGINNQLNVKQQALLKVLHKCLKSNIPLNWNSMVKFYIKSVDSEYSTYDWNRKTQQYEVISYSVAKVYKSQDDTWTYGLKPRIRQWFATNMGSMILKGSILALPVIEIN